jgi:tetratricopeptide (TPR) repeat protein
MSKIANECQLRAQIRSWADDLRQSGATGDERIRAIEDRIKAEMDETALYGLKVELRREYKDKGDDAAVDALDRELMPEVDYWFRQLMRTNRTDFQRSIEVAENRIRSNPDAPEVDELYRCLADLYSLHGDDAASERIYLQLADKHPDDPLPLNTAAYRKSVNRGQSEAALELINRALEVAYRTGELRRFTLGNKARIALELRRYDVVESVLEEIMRLKIDPEVGDIGRERDFFDRLPPDSIDPDVARQYEQYCLAVGLKAHKG